MRRNVRNTSLDSNKLRKDEYGYHYYYDETEIDVFNDEYSWYNSWENNYPTTSRWCKDRHPRYDYYDSDQYVEDDQGLDWYYQFKKDNAKFDNRNDMLSELFNLPKEQTFILVDRKTVEPLTYRLNLGDFNK